MHIRNKRAGKRVNDHEKATEFLNLRESGPAKLTYGVKHIVLRDYDPLYFQGHDGQVLLIEVSLAPGSAALGK